MVGRRPMNNSGAIKGCSSCDCGERSSGGDNNNNKSRSNSSWHTSLLFFFHVNNDNNNKKKSKKNWLIPTTTTRGGGPKFVMVLIILILVLVLVVIIVAYGIHRTIVWHKGSKDWVMSPIMHIERPCPKPEYELLSSTPEGRQTLDEISICLTTLTDEKTSKNNDNSGQFWSSLSTTIRRMIRWRNYDNILELTWESKRAYANKHGYHLYDASHLVEKTLTEGRPAQWGKILAVQKLLHENENDNICDWVLWHDADTLFVNTNKRIEDILPSNPETNLLVAIDYPNEGYNSGSWLIKNSDWSKDFLQKWWDMKSFVRLPGQSLSGDNDAFKVLLNSYLHDETSSNNNDDFHSHVGVPPRCSINSFAKFLRPWELESLQKLTPEQLQQQYSSWYMSPNYYHKGDWLVHVPGYDNKKATIEMMLKEVH